MDKDLKNIFGVIISSRAAPSFNDLILSPNIILNFKCCNSWDTLLYTYKEDQYYLQKQAYLLLIFKKVIS